MARWDNITATQDDDVFFEDYVRLALADEAPQLPAQTIKIGSTVASWMLTEPGKAYISAEGGTIDDRRYACAYLTEALEPHGIQRVSFTLRWDHSDRQMIKEADWNDIEAKAKRLIQSGQVKILRNAPDVIVGYVEGDHGDYQTELHRSDPESQALTLWSCECEWDQFAWQRTRQWKKYEGRVCVMPGTLITLKTGEQIPIEDVKVDDLVLTHNGIGRVTQTMQNDYVGRIFSIYRFGFPDPLEVTEDHEVWSTQTPDSVRNTKYNQGDLSRQGFKINDDSFLKPLPQWVDSQDLCVHDWVASTWVQPTPLGVGYHFATALGYYLAEGNIVSQNGKLTEIQWTFHEDETDLHEALAQALGHLSSARVRTYQYPDRSVVSIRITDHRLAKEFSELAGHYARQKKLAASVLRWPIQDLEALLEAHYQGDGSYNQKDARLTHYTASDDLAQQLFDILVKCEYIPSWQRVANNGGPQNRDAVLTMNRVVYKRQKTGKGNGRRRFEARYMSKITKIEKYEYEGPVYNLAVDNQESYVANGVVVHNCSHVLATWWLAQSMPMDEETNPAAPEGSPSPFGQVPGAGTGMVPPAGTPAPEQQGMQNQMAPAPPQMQVPGQAAEPTELLAPYPQNPALQPAVNPVSVPGLKPQTPLNPVQNPSGTFSSVRYAEGVEYTNGQMVQLKQEDVGQTVGLNSGQSATIPANSIGEVLGTDPMTGMVNVYFAGPQAQAGKLEPHGVVGWFFPSEIIPRSDVRAPGPAIRRR